MLNQIVIMGRLTEAPELKTTNSGVSVCKVNLAVERNHKSGEEKQTDFFTVIAWRGTAEFMCNYMDKGQLIAVQGSMESRKWQDKDGNNRTAWEVVASNVYFAEGKKKQEEPAEENPYQKYKEKAIDIISGNTEEFTPISPNEDLPF